jgi:hypothetical protein
MWVELQAFECSDVPITANRTSVFIACRLRLVIVSTLQA